MASLKDTRTDFTLAVAKLINYIDEQGDKCALNEAGRSDEQAAINALGEEGRARLANLLEADFPTLAVAVANNGKANGILMSVHRDKLAVDLDLYDGNGNYLPDTESHRKYGEYWETLHPLARWGGKFRDGNHYSFEWQGRK